MDRCAEGIKAVEWWRGYWEVVDTASGAMVGHAQVAPWPADPCQLREDVKPTGDEAGYGGALVSTLKFDKKSPNYRQMQVHPDGHGEFLWGTLASDRVVLTGIIGANRLRWTLARRRDGTLRLTIEQSHDAGASWGSAPISDLTYRRAAVTTP